MAFKEVTTGGSNIKSYWPKKAAERKVGDSVVGTYKSKMSRTMPDGTASVLYLLETNDGIVGVNSSTIIARAMESIPEGSVVKIIFNGKKTNPRNGRSFNDFGIFVDDGEVAEAKEEIDFNNLGF